MNGSYILNENPWHGLEAYQDGDILYGRDDDIKSLSNRILIDTETVLYGQSGIGKSSLINAGVIPFARRSGFCPVSVKLFHDDGISYTKQIRNAITDAGITVEAVSESSGNEELLWNLFHGNRFYNDRGERAKLLIIFDQFEEIFTLQHRTDCKRHFFSQVADLLNGVTPRCLTKSKETNSPVSIAPKYVVLTDSDDINFGKIGLEFDSAAEDFIDDNEVHFIFTLREDFLSDFDYFTSAIPSLRQNRYGLRPINEEQAVDIIMRPRMGLVSKDVAKRIIEIVTGRNDFELDGKPSIEVDSAVLSLYLTSLYNEKDGDTITGGLVEEKSGEIINGFYSKCIDGIEESAIAFLENILVNEEGHRENKSESSIVREIGQDVVNRLVGEKLLRRFSYAKDMRIEFIHDILCPVVKRHKEEREHERALLEERALFEERAAKVRMRNRRRVAALSTVIAAMSVAALVVYFLNWHEYASYYAGLTYVNGWPVGDGGKLNRKERQSTALYYKLSHKGWGGHYTDIEIMSSYGKPPMDIQRMMHMDWRMNDWCSPDMSISSVIKKTHAVHFACDVDGRLSKEVYADYTGHLLMYVSYTYDLEKSAWVQFIGSDGNPINISGIGVDRMKITWDTTGLISSLMFYDSDGVIRPIVGLDGLCGYIWDYPDKRTEKCYVLNELSLPLQGAGYNLARTCRNGDTTEVSYYHVLSVDTDSSYWERATGLYGAHRIVTVKDTVYLYGLSDWQCMAKMVNKLNERGNLDERVTDGANALGIAAMEKYKYDEKTGYLTCKELLESDGRTPFGQTGEIYKWEWCYDGQGRLVKEIRIDIDDNHVYEMSRTGNKVDSTVVMEMDSLGNQKYLMTTVADRGDGWTTTSFYGKGGEKVIAKYELGSDEHMDCHKIERKEKKDENVNASSVEYMFYSSDGSRVKTKVNDKGKAISYYKRIESRDCDGNLNTLQLFDSGDKIIKSMKYIYLDGQRVGRYVMGLDGSPVRCPKWEEEGYEYYKLFYRDGFHHRYANLGAFDEFNITSGFYDEAVKKEYMKVVYNDSLRSACMVKEDMSSTEVTFMHVLSKESQLYREGLKDGDRLIQVGSWSYGMPISILESEFYKKGDESRDVYIEVMRPNPKNGTFDHRSFTVRCTGGESLSETDKAEYHTMKLTMQEEERWLREYDKIAAAQE